jgi:hypothetical protein
VIFASYAGAPANPEWFHDQVAHPDATVEIGRETRAVRARVAGKDERVAGCMSNVGGSGTPQ